MRTKLGLTCVCVLFAGGCWSNKDITNDPRYAEARHGYVAGSTYRLVQEVRLGDLESGWRVVDRTNFPMRYRLEKIVPGEAVDPKDVVRAGVRIQIRRILRHENPEDTWTFPIAEILDGPHAGTETDCSGISYTGDGDPHFLQRTSP